jgi:hypothetical protein
VFAEPEGECHEETAAIAELPVYRAWSLRSCLR